MDTLVVIGAGGFGRETLDVVEAVAAGGRQQYRVGVLDDSPRDVDLQRLRERGATYLGTIDSWTAGAKPADQYLLAIGDPVVRHTTAERLRHHGRPADPFVHPAANVGSMVELGAGSIVCAGVQISTNVRSGIHTHVNPGAIIGHDCEIGDFVSVNPGAIVSGSVTLEEKSIVGAGAVVLQGRRVGSSAIVGAAACVVQDVPVGSTVKGVPAR